MTGSGETGSGETGSGKTLLRVQVLGPVRVWRGAEELEIGSAQPRAVLAVLALAGGRAVSRSDLIDAIWDSPTDKADAALFSHVSRLRAALEPGRRSRAPGQALVSVGSGYALRINPGQVDAGAFAKEVSDGRRARSAGDLAGAAALVEHALGLWQGTALAGIASLWADAERAALEEARQAAVEQLAEIKLEMGLHAEMTAELAGLVRKYPFRERLRGLYMLALYRSGRQADALAAFRDARQALDADQGIEPGPALRRLHEQMLAADPALDLRPPTPRRPGDSAFASTGSAVSGQWSGDRTAASAELAADPGDGTTVRFSLPPDAAAFTGRTAELDHITVAIAGAAEAGGVVAIHAIGGMPGVGKTALAVHVAHALRSRFPDRQLFIDLHAHTPGKEPVPADEALAGLLTTVGVDARYLPDGIEGRTGLWRDRMAGQRSVLVLDNVASSAQVAPLLPGTEHCLVLVTSRRHLGDLPGAVAHVMLDVLGPDQARDMFLRLAPLASTGPPEAVTELAELAGFLPLAISLLARVYARHPSWTLADLVQETRASMLTLAAENISVAAAFEVSYRYLLPDQQQFLRRLGIHPGATIDRYAAAALTGTELPEATRYLDTLHREALLTEAGYRRYRMHDLIRRYASEHAATEPAAGRSLALERLLDYYTAALATAQRRLARRTRNAPASVPLAHPAAMPDLADTAAALAWARAERANLLACLAEAAKSGQHARVVALTAGLALVLQQDGPWTDAIALDLTAAEAARQLGDQLSQANALNDLGVMHRLTGQYPAAAEALGEALGIYRVLGDRLGQANALNDLGVVHRMDGQYQVAAEELDQALSVYRALGDRLGEANALHDLGALRLVTGEYADAVTLLQAALAIYRDLHDLLGQADALNYLGDAQRMIGNYSDAAQALEAALGIYRQLGNRRGQANVLNWLGIVRRLTGDYQAAGAAFEEALSIARDIGSRLGQANSLGSLGIMRRIAGDYPGASDALDAALKLYRDLGDKGGEVEILNEAGTLHRLRGELDLAAAYHREALDMARDIESSWDEAHALAGLGRCALSAGEVAGARDLLQRSQRIFEHIGAAETAELAAELSDLA
jgi:DNA-binding SARP family transcriptional activator